MIFNPTYKASSNEIVKIQLERSSGFDGVILFGTRQCSFEDIKINIEELKKSNLPFVVVNMPDFGLEIDQVIDQTEDSMNPLNYLLESGNSKILLLAGSLTNPLSIQVIKKYKELHSVKNLRLDERLIRFADYDKDFAKLEILKVLDDKIEFNSVYCLSDSMALGVYEAFKERNIKIPDNFSVISRDNSKISTYLDPPLTSLNIPKYQIGVKTVELLIDSINSKSKPKKLFLQNSLIFRKSTKN